MHELQNGGKFPGSILLGAAFSTNVLDLECFNRLLLCESTITKKM